MYPLKISWVCKRYYEIVDKPWQFTFKIVHRTTLIVMLTLLDPYSLCILSVAQAEIGSWRNDYSLVCSLVPSCYQTSSRGFWLQKQYDCSRHPLFILFLQNYLRSKCHAVNETIVVTSCSEHRNPDSSFLQSFACCGCGFYSVQLEWTMKKAKHTILS